MKLSRLRQLGLSPYGRVDSPKVRQSRSVRVATQDLRYTRLRLLELFVVTPVACGEGITQSIGDGRALYRRVQVEITLRLYALLGEAFVIQMGFPGSGSKLSELTLCSALPISFVSFLNRERNMDPSSGPAMSSRFFPK